jgi:UPF0716 protein FxsA
MFFRLLLLFTLVPLIELYILIKLGSVYGAFTTIALVIGTGLLGAWLAKQQGLLVWMKIQEQTSQGRLPAEQLIDGFLILVAGVVLLTPGLLTDITGFLLLVPFTRALIKVWVKNKLKKMMQAGNVRMTGFVE